VRTTLTLEEDVAARLKREARKSGLPFKAVVNETLRRGFAATEARRKQPAYRIKPRSMGVYPGLDYSNTGALLEYAEGPGHK
jgi:hypothetical protein